MSDLKDWRAAVPGDAVAFLKYTSLESISFDKEVLTGPRTEYCLCVGRDARTTASGLTNVRIYFLTSSGVAYKRFSEGGDRTDGRQRQKRRV